MKTVDNSHLEDLILRDRQGEPVRDEMIALLDRTVNMTYASHFQQLEGDAEDLKQEAITTVLERLHLWQKSRGKAWSFFSRMALNRMRDISRSNRRRSQSAAKFLGQIERDSHVRGLFCR